MSETELKTRKPNTVKFIFMGDPTDNGAGSRVIDHDDENEFRGAVRYGMRFPKGKAVEVPVDAKIGPESHITIVSKLRGNNHYFEGDEAEFKAAKDAGRIKFKKAPEKTPVLVKEMGVMRKRPKTSSSASDGDDD